MIGFPKLALGIALSGVFALPLMGNRDDALPDISFNDNLAAAGRLASGTLTISLEVRKGRWFPLGKDHAPAEVLAFGPAGEPLTTPGPMLRVPLGTAMRVRVTNASETTVVVRGLSSRLQPVMDTLLLAPGATGEARFTADAEGTFYYWAGEPGRPMTGVPVERRRLYDDAQLNGASSSIHPGTHPRATNGSWSSATGLPTRTAPAGRTSTPSCSSLTAGRGPTPSVSRIRWATACTGGSSTPPSTCTRCTCTGSTTGWTRAGTVSATPPTGPRSSGWW
jgi:hypothetical protein